MAPRRFEVPGGTSGIGTGTLYYAGMSFDQDAFSYRGARALALLHDRHLRACAATWQLAAAAGIEPPEQDSGAYRSLESIMLHVLEAAYEHMIWICRDLGLPDPGLDEPPREAVIERQLDDYLEHLLDRWPGPLTNLDEERFREEVTADWGETFTVEALVEHTVMHALRHELQLAEWLAARAG